MISPITQVMEELRQLIHECRDDPCADRTTANFAMAIFFAATPGAKNEIIERIVENRLDDPRLTQTRADPTLQSASWDRLPAFAAAQQEPAAVPSGLCGLEAPVSDDVRLPVRRSRVREEVVKVPVKLVMEKNA